MTAAAEFFVLLMNLLIALCGMGILIYILYVLFTVHRPVPYVPTPYAVIRAMIDAAALTARDRVVDLGSGSGRIVVEVARRVSVTVTGVEYSPLLLFAARLRALVTRRRGRIQWLQGDMYAFPLRDTTAVLCFLTGDALRRLAPAFASMARGSRVVTHKFEAPLRDGWERRVVPIRRYSAIYVYTKQT
ncbi:class I SAM-dependent methyltransferase [Candidatus Uhrbacteria bacterium]|nr:class I SAM-dependent methyltransferase [Candidatus Uhrbacteria bacterium]